MLSCVFILSVHFPAITHHTGKLYRQPQCFGRKGKRLADSLFRVEQTVSERGDRGNVRHNYEKQQFEAYVGGMAEVRSQHR